MNESIYHQSLFFHLSYIIPMNSDSRKSWNIFFLNIDFSIKVFTSISKSSFKDNGICDLLKPFWLRPEVEENRNVLDETTANKVNESLLLLLYCSFKTLTYDLYLSYPNSLAH
jgi:hypothetical protein